MRRLHLTNSYAGLGRCPGFASFWFAGVISLFGDRLHQVALAVLTLAVTGSPLITAAMLAASIGPSVFIGPIAGVAVDRLPRKTALIGADLVRAVLVLAVPPALYFSPLLAIALVGCVGAANSLFLPAKSAAVADLVPPEMYDAANGATWTADAMADLLGYPLAALVVVVLSPVLWVAFIVDSASYLISAAAIARVSFPPHQRSEEPRERIGVSLRSGAAVLWDDRALRVNTALTAVAQVFSGAEIALLVIYAREVSGWPLTYPADYPILEASLGLGALIGASVAGVLSGPLGRRILIGFVGMGISGLALAAAPILPVAIVAIAVSGVFNLLWVVPTQSMALSRLPRYMIGRAVAVRRSVTTAVLVVAMLASGAAADIVGVRAVLGVGALLVIVASALAAISAAGRRPENEPLPTHSEYLPVPSGEAT